MRRFGSTYLLLIVALGLFSYIFFFDVKNKSTDEAKKTETSIFGFKPGGIRSLEITNLKGTFVLEKKGDQWVLTKPVVAPADSTVVGQMTEALQYAFNHRVIPYSEIPKPREETIKQWNLNPPSTKVFFKTENRSGEILFGRNVALSDFVYARASDQAEDPIQIVSGNFKKVFDKGLDEIRSRSLFNTNISTLSSCDIQEFASGIQAARETEVVKNKMDRWTIQKPIQARASTYQLRTWIDDLNKLTVVDFTSDESQNLSPFGLSTPIAQISLKDSKNEETTLLIGTQVPQKPDLVYAKQLKSNSVFTLKKADVMKVIAGFINVRDRFLMAFDPKMIAKISFSEKGKTITVHRNVSRWEVETSPPLAADAQKVEHILDILTVTEASFVKDSAIDLRSYGLDKPFLKVTLWQEIGMTPQTIELDLGKNDKTQIYAKTSLEPFIYGVSPDLLQLFPKDEFDLKSLQILNLPPEKLRSFKVKDAHGLEINSVLGADHLYHSDQSNVEIDDLKTDAKTKLLEHLQALQWLGKPLPEYHFESPLLTVTIEADKEIILKIGSRLTNGNYPAILEGDDLAFELAATDFEMLSQSSIFSPPAIKKSVP